MNNNNNNNEREEGTCVREINDEKRKHRVNDIDRLVVSSCGGGRTLRLLAREAARKGGCKHSFCASAHRQESGRYVWYLYLYA